MIVLQSSPGSEMWQWVLIALAAVVVLYIFARPMLQRRRSAVEAGPVISPAQQRALERDITGLLHELSETARQITSQMDARAERLETLIRQADERLAAMQALRPRADGAAPSFEPGPDWEPHTDARHSEVYELADAGHTPQQIAERLGLPNGEIELILALRPQR